MAITNFDGITKAMATSNTLTLTRTSVSTMIAGTRMSHWRGVGFPAQGGIPTTSTVCSSSTIGALPILTAGVGEDLVILTVGTQLALAGHTLQIEDRLAHMGGLSGILTTAQTVNLDVSLTTNNLTNRIGSPDYSEVEWYLDWYTATGATVATPTVQVTYHDNTNGSVGIWNLGATALPASVAAQRRYQIIPTNGKYIKSIQSITLSASTGTAGNFGITAIRPLTKCECTIANTLQVRNWDYLTLPVIENEACITLSQNCATTTSGVLYISLTQGKA